MSIISGETLKGLALNAIQPIDESAINNLWIVLSVGAVKIHENQEIDWVPTLALDESIPEGSDPVSQVVADTSTVKIPPRQSVLLSLQQTVALPEDIYGQVTIATWYANRGLAITQPVFIPPGVPTGPVFVGVSNVLSYNSLTITFNTPCFRLFLSAIE